MTLGRTAGSPGAREAADKGCGGSTWLDLAFQGGEGAALSALVTLGTPRSAGDAGNAVLGARLSEPRRANELKPLSPPLLVFW